MSHDHIFVIQQQLGRSTKRPPINHVTGGVDYPQALPKVFNLQETFIADIVVRNR